MSSESITFGSACSGIEAASVAFGPLGWRAAWLAEIDKFASAVLAHHYPTVPNLGDMTTIARRVLSGEVDAPDVLCGGTPCQAFSVAGLRESLADARGNLTLKFVELADAIDHRRDRDGKPAACIFWENVPGVLSTKDNAFGCFLAGLAGEDEPLVAPGKKWANAGAVYGPRRAIAWRTLDAQYFGLAQRRRRVFVVASARDGFDPAAVLFEWDGVRRDSAPGRGTEEGIAPTCAGGSRQRGGFSYDDIPLTANTLLKGGHGNNPLDETLVPFDTTQITSAANYSNPQSGDPCHPIAAGAHAPAVAYTTKLHNTASNNAGKVFEERTAGLDANSPPPALLMDSQVRRLTPRECERLQGFPDDWTDVPHRGRSAADGPRYKALGNSWAVPCARWIGTRIDNALRQHA